MLILTVTASGQTTKLVNDAWGRSFIWHSAFKINFSNGVTLQDPGVYVRNDSNLVVTVSSSVVNKMITAPPITPHHTNTSFLTLQPNQMDKLRRYKTLEPFGL